MDIKIFNINIYKIQYLWAMQTTKCY